MLAREASDADGWKPAVHSPRFERRGRARQRSSDKGLAEGISVSQSTTLDRGRAPRRSPTRRSSRRAVRPLPRRHPGTQAATRRSRPPSRRYKPRSRARARRAEFARLPIARERLHQQVAREPMHWIAPPRLAFDLCHCQWRQRRASLGLGRAGQDRELASEHPAMPQRGHRLLRRFGLVGLRTSASPTCAQARFGRGHQPRPRSALPPGSGENPYRSGLPKHRG
jgi:hypothetical protein